MTYSVKEIFYTLQGEGANAGRPAVFCRFTGCNLWTGREEDRATAVCQFCDTDFVGTDGTLGGKFRAAEELAAQITALWPTADRTNRLVVLTGGEPLLQVDAALIDALHAQGFSIAVESNGTVKAPAGIDWLCISPKAGTFAGGAAAAGVAWVQKSGQELKVVWPQQGIDLAQLAALDFPNKYLQPMDNGLTNSKNHSNTQACIDQCLTDPTWRLSLQTHKITGIR
jgi:7-carboxy-7-deazaguanine synthase